MQGYELSSYDSMARPMAGARSNPVFNVTRARKKAESEIRLVGPGTPNNQFFMVVSTG